jgi:hypothetical protein
MARIRSCFLVGCRIGGFQPLGVGGSLESAGPWVPEGLMRFVVPRLFQATGGGSASGCGWGW